MFGDARVRPLTSSVCIARRETTIYVSQCAVEMSTRKNGSLVHDEEVNDAAWVAARGAGVGAAKWGLFSAAAAGLGYAFSPVYRGLTFQFKVFLQMSGMTLGSMIEADRRLRAHELAVRQRKKIARDAAVWRRYEEDYEVTSRREHEPTSGGGKGER